jgi:hypothetical protein
MIFTVEEDATLKCIKSEITANCITVDRDCSKREQFPSTILGVCSIFRSNTYYSPSKYQAHPGGYNVIISDD